MTKVTWLGDGSEAEENEWNGTVFKKGEAVELKDEAMVNKAKGNRFYKVAGNKAETIEDNPPSPAPYGRPDDLPENIAFAPQERLNTHREQSRLAAEAGDERAEQPRRGRPRKNPPKGGSETAAERVPPREQAAPKTGEAYPTDTPPPPAAKQF